MSDSLQPQGLQHTRLPCPSPMPGACSNSFPSSWQCHPTICIPLPLPPSVFPRVFSNESALHIRWLKYWRFIFSISPCSEYSGLISFRVDWFDLLAVQGTLKSLLQHHSSKVLILWRSAFFIVQLSHPYTTTGKTIALTRRTFVGKVMSLVFNMLSRLVIAFLPRSKRLLISWLQSTSAVIFGAPQNKVCHCFHCSFAEGSSLSFRLDSPDTGPWRVGLGSSNVLRKCSYIGREEGSSGGSWGRGARVWLQQSPAEGGTRQPDPVGILGNGLSLLAVPICGRGAGLFILLYLSHWIRTDWGGKGECKFPDTSRSPPSWAKCSPVARGKCSKQSWKICV